MPLFHYILEEIEIELSRPFEKISYDEVPRETPSSYIFHNLVSWVKEPSFWSVAIVKIEGRVLSDAENGKLARIDKEIRVNIEPLCHLLHDRIGHPSEGTRMLDPINDEHFSIPG